LRTQEIGSQDQAKAFWIIQDKFADLYSVFARSWTRLARFPNFQKIPDYKQVRNGAVGAILRILRAFRTSVFRIGLRVQGSNLSTCSFSVQCIPYKFVNARYTSGCEIYAFGAIQDKLNNVPFVFKKQVLQIPQDVEIEHRVQIYGRPETLNQEKHRMFHFISNDKNTH